MNAAKVVAGAFWSGVTVLGTMVAGFVTSVIVARALGNTDFGRYGYAAWLGATLGQVATLGVARPLNRFIPSIVRDSRYSAAKMLASRALFWTFVVASALAIGLGLFASRLSIPRNASMSAIMGSLVIGTAVTAIATVVLQSLMRFREVTRATLLGSVSTLVGTVILAVLHASWVSQLALVAAATTISAGMLLVSFRTALPANADGEQAEAPLSAGEAGRYRDYWISAAALMAMELVIWQRFELFFLQRQSTPAALGHYNAAIAISARAVALPMALAPVVYPVIARMRLADESGQMHAAYRQFIKYLALVAVPLFVIPAAAAAPILSSLFGPSYAGAAPALAILLVGGLIPVMSVAGSAVVYGTDRIGFALRCGSLCALMTLALDALLVRRFGAVGAALGNLSGQLLAVVLTYYLVLRPQGFRFPLAVVAPIFLAGLASGATVRLLLSLQAGWIGLALAGLAGLAVYFVAMRLVRPLDSSDGPYVEAFRARVPAFLQPRIQRMFDAASRGRAVP